MENPNYKKLIQVLEEIFQLNQADLDFGIYRIMNHKRAEIVQFLEHDLIPQVKSILAKNLSTDKTEVQRQLDEAIKSAKALGADPETLPKVQQLRTQLTGATDLEAEENQVFHRLANFFSRYYEGGDFVSLRRYKEGVYAIPYEGEEVKLHWANHDQYYIKTSEYLKNYAFKIGNGKTVKFVLAEATTEQNNNKAAKGMERRFALREEEPLAVVGDELQIYFTYEPTKKTSKQSDLMQAAFDTLKAQIPAAFQEVLVSNAQTQTEKKPNRTLLEKHFKQYAARNSFDYFIHKNLGKFLRTELDFYIKNEVLLLDDINTRDTNFFVRQLSQVRALKEIGRKIIAFLEQLENFQKKLWLKKKFVVETQYCLTLDRIPESFYEAIAANTEQINEWKTLFHIQNITADAATQPDLFKDQPKPVAYSEPLTIDFLRANPFLVLDTRFFSEKFTHDLLAEIDNLDEQLDGLLINSENFQALNLLQERYREQVKCTYIDPPYNKGSDFAYKDNFRHSSWLSFIIDRLSQTKRLFNKKGIIFSSIDKHEIENLKRVFEDAFSNENTILLPAITNLKGNQDTDGFASTHEYLVCSANSSLQDIGRLKIDEENLLSNWREDSYGLFKQADGLRATGANAPREKRPNLFYPIFINTKTNDFYTTPDDKPKSVNDSILWPINSKGEELSWYWKRSKVNDEKYNLILKSGKNGYSIYKKQRPGLGDIPSKKPKTTFYSPKYSSTNGGNLAKEIFGERMSDFTPKSVDFVGDLVYLGGSTHSTILDYFAGSGTTAHAVINLNREDGGKRKYILVEMGEYFDSVTKPRIQKVIYSKDWKDGRPVSREGSSHAFKYLRLESYEDALNNLTLQQTDTQQLVLKENDDFREGYMLHYLLDTATQSSLLNLSVFENPFDYHLHITRHNDTRRTRVDLVETFNYLLGIVVEKIATIRGFRVVEGHALPKSEGDRGDRLLIIWRNVQEKSNEELDTFFQKMGYNTRDRKFDRIYVNGDNNLENLKVEGDKWKVVLIEEAFGALMFGGE